jgi:acyl CoA:acetate/3-ketoacid CoA transferase beta subunit
MEVSENGDSQLENQEKWSKGMGGAMDLVLRQKILL